MVTRTILLDDDNVKITYNQTSELVVLTLWRGFQLLH